MYAASKLTIGNKFHSQAPKLDTSANRAPSYDYISNDIYNQKTPVRTTSNLYQANYATDGSEASIYKHSYHQEKHILQEQSIGSANVNSQNTNNGSSYQNSYFSHLTTKTETTNNSNFPLQSQTTHHVTEGFFSKYNAHEISINKPLKLPSTSYINSYLKGSSGKSKKKNSPNFNQGRSPCLPTSNDNKENKENGCNRAKSAVSITNFQQNINSNCGAAEKQLKNQEPWISDLSVRLAELDNLINKTTIGSNLTDKLKIEKNIENQLAEPNPPSKLNSTPVISSNFTSVPFADIKPPQGFSFVKTAFDEDYKKACENEAQKKNSLSKKDQVGALAEKISDLPLQIKPSHAYDFLSVKTFSNYSPPKSMIEKILPHNDDSLGKKVNLKEASPIQNKKLPTPPKEAQKKIEICIDEPLTNRSHSSQNLIETPSCSTEKIRIHNKCSEFKQNLDSIPILNESTIKQRIASSAVTVDSDEVPQIIQISSENASAIDKISSNQSPKVSKPEPEKKMQKIEDKETHVKALAKIEKPELEKNKQQIEDNSTKNIRSKTPGDFTKKTKQNIKPIGRHPSNPSIKNMFGGFGWESAKHSGAVTIEQLSKRLEDQASQIEKKKELLIQRSKEDTMKECTFAPRINSKKANRNQKRSLTEFITSQKDHCKKKETKIKEVLEKKEETELSSLTFKPKINEKSKKLAETKNTILGISITTPFQERLYQQKKDAFQKKLENIINSEVSECEDIHNESTLSKVIKQNKNKSSTSSELSEVTFKPTINPKSQKLKREGKIEDILFQRGQELKLKKEKAIENELKNKKNAEKVFSNNSEKFLINRFLKELDHIYNSSNIPPDYKINYVQMVEVLRRLGFISTIDNLELPHFNSERTLLFDMWTILKGDELGGITKKNLFIFSLAILGLNYYKDSQPETELKSKQFATQLTKDAEDERFLSEKSESEINTINKLDDEGARIGKFDKNQNFILNSEEVKLIHNAYELFYISRLNDEDVNARTFKEIIQYSFFPEILDSSKVLAAQYREKLLGEAAALMENNLIQIPADGKLTHTDLLVIKKKADELLKLKLKEERECEVMKECSFKPSLATENSMYFMNASRRMTSSNGVEKTEELYSLAKQKQKKFDRPKEEIEFEKQVEECTFTPNLFTNGIKKFNETMLKNNSSISVLDVSQVKDANKSIQRMREARVQQEKIHLKKQRGENGHKSSQSMSFILEKNKFKSSFDSSDQINTKKSQKNFKKINEKNYSSSNILQNLNKTQLDMSSILSTNGMQNADGKEPFSTSTIEIAHNENNRINLQKTSVDSNSHTPNTKNSNYIDKNNSLIEQSLQANEEPAQSFEEERENTHNSLEECIDSGVPTNQSGVYENIDNRNIIFDAEDNERIPLLFVDVNLGGGRSERIIVYEGDKSDILAEKFAVQHNLDENMKGKLKQLLEAQISGILTRIDEENSSCDESGQE